MSPKTKFKLIRKSIYLTGLFIILGTVFYNAWQIKEKTFQPIKTENGDLAIFTDKTYQKAELTLEVTEKIPENLTVTLEKDFYIFLDNPSGAIYTEEELKEKLFEENDLEYPNGKIINYQNKNYIVQRGHFKEILDNNFLKILGINKDNLNKIGFDKETLSTIDYPLNEKDLRENFPERILFEKNGDFYLTGTGNYRPVYISNIKDLIEKYNIQTVSFNSQPVLGKCYKKSNPFSKIICDFELEKISAGNIYRVKIENNNQLTENIKQAKLKFFK
jgi:hypothetical protein